MSRLRRSVTSPRRLVTATRGAYLRHGGSLLGRRVRAHGRGRRRSRSGCGRARSTSSSGRSTCSASTRRCGSRSPRIASARRSSTGRRAPGRRRSRASSPTTTGAEFEELSAVSATVKDVREVLARARERLGTHGPAHDPLPRRDPPLQQGAAGRAAAGRRGRARDADRRDDREPVLRGQLARCSRARRCTSSSRSRRRRCASVVRRGRGRARRGARAGARGR